MTWGFLWLMLALKLPIAALIYIVWWAIKQEPDEPASDDDGGIKRQPAASAAGLPAPAPARARTGIRLRLPRPGFGPCAPRRARSVTEPVAAPPSRH